MSVSHRTRVDSFAAGMSPLIALLPWELAKASGADEERALLVAWCCLPALTLFAVALRATTWGRKSYFMAVYRESFSMPKYLRELALWSAFYAASSLAVWFSLPG